MMRNKHCSCRRHRRQGEKDSAAETAAAIAAATTLSSVGKLHSPWRRGFFDRLIRNSESYVQKWEYVRENLFVPDWLADPRIAHLRVKYWRLTAHEGSAACDGEQLQCMRELHNCLVVDGWLLVVNWG